MLTIKQITDDTDKVIRGLEKKHFANAKEAIAKVLECNDRRRNAQNQLDKNLAEVNSLSKSIGMLMKEGTDITIVATGLCVGEALNAAETLSDSGINAEVINIHTIKPLDKDIILASANKTGIVVTCEEHSIIGGLGSAVCELLSEYAPTKVLRIGVNDSFGESGPAAELIKKYGLDAGSIAEKVRQFYQTA